MQLNRNLWKQNFYIGNRMIGPGTPCYVIAEIGANFNKDYTLTQQMIDTAAECGADAVKFQTYRGEDLVAEPGLTHSYRTSTGDMVTVSQLEMFKEIEFPYEWHKPLKKYAESKGVQFLSSAADTEAVELLKSISVPVMKIASEDLINIPVVERIAESGYPTLLSTGMASEEEITNALEIFAKHKNFRVV